MADLHKHLAHSNPGGFGLFGGICDGTCIFLYEAIEWGVVRASSCMFETIFVCEGVPFLGAEGLPIAGDLFLGGSFEVVDECLVGGTGHLEKESVFEEIVNYEEKLFTIPVHEVCVKVLPGPWGTSWLIRDSAGSVGNNLMPVGHCTYHC